MDESLFGMERGGCGINIVLDMDQTLIDGHYITGNGDLTVSARPYLKEFLIWCFDNFDNVSIWTAASKQWFDYVNQNIFKPILQSIGKKFDKVWVGDRVTFAWQYSEWHGHSVNTKQKRLSKLYRQNRNIGGNPYNKHNTIMVDDSKASFQINYGNGIEVKPWYSGGYKPDEDTELKELMVYFDNVLFPHFKNIKLSEI
jgi:hypothetical protein